MGMLKIVSTARENYYVVYVVVTARKRPAETHDCDLKFQKANVILPLVWRYGSQLLAFIASLCFHFIPAVLIYVNTVV